MKIKLAAKGLIYVAAYAYLICILVLREFFLDYHGPNQILQNTFAEIRLLTCTNVIQVKIKSLKTYSHF